MLTPDEQSHCRYALLRMPDGRIEIEDRTTNIGRGRINNLCLDGGVPVGFLDSELQRSDLLVGVRKPVQDTVERLQERISKAGATLDGYMYD